MALNLTGFESESRWLVLSCQSLLNLIEHHYYQGISLTLVKNKMMTKRTGDAR